MYPNRRDDGRTDSEAIHLRIPAKLRVDFDGCTITSDAGLTLIREIDERFGITADVVSRGQRSAGSTIRRSHVGDIIRQRLYQIVAGYEDVNDASRFKDDPTFQVISSGSMEILGSQPTL